MITKRATKHIVATLIIAAVISGSFFAEGLGREEFFDTKNFNVEAELLSSNTLHVKETIVVDFKLYRHGIYRTIPYKGVFRMVKDGKTIEENVRAKISDIDVKGRNFEKEKEDGILKLRIGDEDSYVKGLQTYEISYKVQFYESSIKDFDFFYFNILPHRWPTAIEKARVNMVYPKKVPVDKMSVIVGSDGLRDNISLQENSSGKVYWNYSFKNLTTGVTIHNYLPRNYFRNVPEISRFNFPVKAASLLSLILSFLLWLLFGRDPKTIKTVELKPPENMDPMEMAFQLKGKLDGKDVTSEIIYLGT